VNSTWQMRSSTILLLACALAISAYAENDLRSEYEALDTDHNGVLTRDEFVAGMAAQNGEIEDSWDESNNAFVETFMGEGEAKNGYTSDEVDNEFEEASQEANPNRKKCYNFVKGALMETPSTPIEGFECPGARKCCPAGLESKSLSYRKSAGFCVVPSVYEKHCTPKLPKPVWGAGEFAAYKATLTPRGPLLSKFGGSAWELPDGGSYPSQNAHDAFQIGFAQGKDNKITPPMGKETAPTLFRDLTTSFDPTRVLYEARPQIPKMGETNFLVDGVTKKMADNNIAKELAAFRQYMKKVDAWGAAQIPSARLFVGGATQDLVAEGNPVKSAFCGGTMKTSGSSNIKGTWTVTSGASSKSCNDKVVGVHKELYTIGWPWYQAGLIAGWMDKKEHLPYASVYGTVELQHTVSFGVNVMPGHRGRGGGWHIDMAFDKTHDNIPPVYFVSTDDHPTLFFKGQLSKYIDPADLAKLGKHSCGDGSGGTLPKGCKKEPFVQDVMGAGPQGGTYQSPYFDFPILGEAAKFNRPAISPEPTTATPLENVPGLQNEPPCQYISGLINTKVFDSEMRTDLSKVCFGKMQIATVTPDAPTCIAPATLVKGARTYTLGPTDNPTGGAFRKLVTDRFPDLEKTDSKAYEQEIEEVPADLSMGLMGPYRIHNAGARKKTELKTDPLNCGPQDRMFSRLTMIPVSDTLQRIGYKAAQNGANLKDELTRTSALKDARAKLKAPKTELVEDDEWELLQTASQDLIQKQDALYIAMVAARAAHTD